jgi:hypothetical protein
VSLELLFPAVVVLVVMVVGLLQVGRWCKKCVVIGGACVEHCLSPPASLYFYQSSGFHVEYSQHHEHETASNEK